MPSMTRFFPGAIMPSCVVAGGTKVSRIEDRIKISLARGLGFQNLM